VNRGRHLAPPCCNCEALADAGLHIAHCAVCRRELRFYRLDMSPKAAPAVAYCQTHDPKWNKKEGI